MKTNRIMHLFSKAIKYLSVGALGACVAVAIEYGWSKWSIAGVIITALNFALYLDADIRLTKEAEEENV